MDKKPQFKLTEGSRYRIISIGGRENPLETEGIFTGFSTLGIDEIGLIMNTGDDVEQTNGNTRIIPLHAILAIDVLDEKEHVKKEEDPEANHYYG